MVTINHDDTAAHDGIAATNALHDVLRTGMRWGDGARMAARKFVYHSDVVRMSGEVTRRYIADDGEACVDVRTRSNNQRDEDVMPGTATIALPRRGFQSPVERRVS